MVISEFSYFSILTTKIENFVFFSKIITNKIRNFQVIKNGIYVIEIHTKNKHTKFQSNIFFWLCNGQKKTGKGDDVTFLKCNFWHF